MSDEAQAPKEEHWRTDPDPERCHARSHGERCRLPIDHEKHSLEGGWHWWANRPDEASDRANELARALAQARAERDEAKASEEESYGHYRIAAEQRDALAAKVKELEEQLPAIEHMVLENMRAWSQFGACPCPACVYENGVYKSPCGPHAEAESTQKLLDEARDRVAVLEDAVKASDDFLAILGQINFGPKPSQEEFNAVAKRFNETRRALSPPREEKTRTVKAVKVPGVLAFDPDEDDAPKIPEREKSDPNGPKLPEREGAPKKVEE